MTREEAIDILLNTSFFGRSMEDIDGAIDMAIEALQKQPEPLTDSEQRIFLAAIGKEKEVCKQIDAECRKPYKDSLIRICHEIVRKVKDALW